MINDYFSLALSNFRHRGIRSWLTMLGIFIGIAAVVSLITMGAGLRAAVLGQFGVLSVDKLTIQNKGAGFGPPGSTVIEKLNGDDLEIIENVRGVELVITRLIRVGELEYNKVSGFGYGTDVPEDSELREEMYSSNDIEIDEGKLLESGDLGKIMLGSSFKNTEDFEKPFRIGKTAKINGKAFEVVGILQPSSSFQMNSVVYLMKRDMEDLFDAENEYDLIVAKVEDKDEIEEVAEEIKRKLRDDRNEDLGDETFTVETPLQALGAVDSILNIINAIVVGIAMISLFVGGIGIANTMYTSVVERTREIGIMKAVGAKNSNILMMFLVEAGMLGLVGGIIGALLGLGAAFGIAEIANSAIGTGIFSVAVSYPLLIGAVSFSFIVGVVSGVLPAFQASKINVVDAIRT